MTRRRIAMFTLGGTISMAGTEGGVVARLGGADLASGVSGLDDVTLDIRDVIKVPSASLTFDTVLDVVDMATAAIDSGTDGVVLTQGTDTLEETAFLIDSLWRHEAPFVIT